MNVARFIDETCQRYGSRCAVEAPGLKMTYTELGDSVDRLAGGLWGLGLRPGDAVGVLMTNSVEWILLDLALMKAGLAHVRLHTKLSVSELEYIVRDASCRAVAGDGSLLAPLLDDASRYPSVQHWLSSSTTSAAPAGTHPIAALGQTPRVRRTGWELHPDTVSAVRYTAGTTGRPKGALFTHATRLQGIARFLVEGALSAGQPGALRHPKRNLCVAPLTHATATQYYWTFATGGVNMLVDNRSWDPEQVAAQIIGRDVTHCFLVPTMIHDLLSLPSGVTSRLRDTLETVVYGASVMHGGLLDRAHERLGPILVQLFGMTEADGCYALLDGHDHRLASGSVGRPFATTNYLVVDHEGAALPTGEIGEISAWGPMLMTGYLNNPEASSRALVGGRLRTGDMGCTDERGYLYFAERQDDVIVSGGLNVYPLEVEDAMGALPGVIDCAVVGRPHERWGEEVVAVVVAGDEFDASAVRDRLSGALARYKHPKEVRLVAELPRNQTGKVQRAALRSMVSASDGATS